MACGVRGECIAITRRLYMRFEGKRVLRSAGVQVIASYHGVA